jgi:DNA-binding transcriptional ArsR family regulator
MSSTSFPAVADALLNLLWRQWHELGAPAARQKSTATQSIIDPEALVLCSLAMVEREPRLADALVSWCAANSAHLSVQRLNNLARDYPEGVPAQLPGLAHVMVKAGHDFRWRSLAGPGTPPTDLMQRAPKQSTVVPLDRPSALLLRMRALFGLGLRADIVTFLLRKRDPQEYSDAGEIARALGYNRTAVKRTLDVLGAAGVVIVTEGADPGYAIGWSRAYNLLSREINRLPHWKYAHQTFLWVIALLNNRKELSAGPEFLHDLVLRRLLRDHVQFLTAQAELFDHSEIRGTLSLEAVAGATSSWLKAF